MSYGPVNCFKLDKDGNNYLSFKEVIDAVMDPEKEQDLPHTKALYREFDKLCGLSNDEYGKEKNISRTDLYIVLKRALEKDRH